MGWLGLPPKRHKERQGGDLVQLDLLLRNPNLCSLGGCHNFPGCKIPRGDRENREKSTACPYVESVPLCIKRIKDSLS